MLRWRMDEIERLKEENRGLRKKMGQMRGELVRAELAAKGGRVKEERERPLPGKAVEEQLRLELDRARSEVAVLERDNRALYAGLLAKVEVLPRGTTDADGMEMARALGIAAADAEAAIKRADAAEEELAQLMGAVEEVQAVANELAGRNSELEVEIGILRDRQSVFDTQMEEAAVENDALLEYAHSRATESMILADQVQDLEENEDYVRGLEAKYAAALEINNALEKEVRSLRDLQEESGVLSLRRDLDQARDDAEKVRAELKAAKTELVEREAVFREAQHAAKAMAGLREAYMDVRIQLSEARSAGVLTQ